MLVYATSAELMIYMGGSGPANAAALLRSATGVIRKATKFAVYGIGSDGYASDATVRAALRDATCAQVEFWHELEYNAKLGAAGAEPIITAEAVPGGSVSYFVDPDLAKEALNLVDKLAPLARDELAAVPGLLSRTVWGH